MNTETKNMRIKVIYISYNNNSYVFTVLFNKSIFAVFVICTLYWLSS